MVHACVVPGCSNRSDRETSLSYFHLPLKDKGLLKTWIYKIGRKNLPLNSNSRICSEHFVNASGRRLRKDEYPSTNVPKAITTPVRKRKSPVKRNSFLCPTDEPEDSDSDDPATADVGVETTEHFDDYYQLKEEIVQLNSKMFFRISHIADDNKKVQFYTGFTSYNTLLVCYNFLGPAVNSLNYWGSGNKSSKKSPGGKSRCLPPLEEFFLVLVRLRLGLFEKDLAYCFGISVSTVCRICTTWINFLVEGVTFVAKSRSS